MLLVALRVFRAPEAPAAREARRPHFVRRRASKPARALRSLRHPPHQWGLVCSWAAALPLGRAARWAGLLGVPVGGGPPARSPHASFARRVVSKPGQAPPPPTGTAARPVDQVARLSETPVAFARLYLCGVETAIAFAGAGRASTETAIAFAGEKSVFLVQFSGAEVMPVSMAPCWGCAVVLLVSMSPWCRANRPCAGLGRSAAHFRLAVVGGCDLAELVGVDASIALFGAAGQVNASRI